MRISPVVTGALAGLLFASAAMAQSAPAPKSPPAPEVKTIGDWQVRCFQMESPSPCDMFQELYDKNTKQRVLSISLAYIPRMDRHAIQVVVPLGVAIPKGLVVQTDSFTSKMLPYRRCDRSGCYVEMVLDNNAVNSLSHSGPDARVKVVADGGRNFDLRFSLNGFAAAHDSMADLAKQKAKEPKPVAPPDGSAPAPAAPQ